MSLSESRGKPAGPHLAAFLDTLDKKLLTSIIGLAQATRMTGLVTPDEEEQLRAAMEFELAICQDERREPNLWAVLRLGFLIGRGSVRVRGKPDFTKPEDN